MHEAIAKLPAEQQSVIYLSFIKGLAHSEIAEQLGLPLGTVKSHLHNIYQKLEASSRTEAVARARELDLL